MNVHYHSVHGAVQESKHVFIEAGLRFAMQKHAELTVLEIGFGTGLNALLTLAGAENDLLDIMYLAVEKFPLQEQEYSKLDYSSEGDPGQLMFMHRCHWEDWIEISPRFSLFKTRQDIAQLQIAAYPDVIYFDAFAPSAQPELWTHEVFASLYKQASDNCVLVTYCSKGDVRRALLASGWKVEKLPGPPGKREMLRAQKSS